MIKLMVLLLGCVSTKSEAVEPPQDIVYARNLSFSVNGTNYTGIANVPGLRSYEIKAKFKNKFDHVRFLTCAREETFQYREDEWKFTWNPNEIERDGLCYARLEFFNKDAEFHWGIISPSWHPSEKLKATMNCNGSAFNAVGSHLCQTRVGLNQRLIFWEPVDKFYVGEDCKKSPEIKQSADKRTFDWVAPSWFCTVVFRKGDDLFKLMSFGYEKTYVAKE